eukprot:GHVU01218592.1.p4 GENE.GHVU01218592.1~~GHVU01218592.1.p4  ORF type:complete len:101 (-),score=16.21 GHVU01218592.1:41-343(-)
MREAAVGHSFSQSASQPGGVQPARHSGTPPPSVGSVDRVAPNSRGGNSGERSPTSTRVVARRSLPPSRQAVVAALSCVYEAAETHEEPRVEQQQQRLHNE